MALNNERQSQSSNIYKRKSLSPVCAWACIVPQNSTSNLSSVSYIPSLHSNAQALKHWFTTLPYFFPCPMEKLLSETQNRPIHSGGNCCRAQHTLLHETGHDLFCYRDSFCKGLLRNSGGLRCDGCDRHCGGGLGQESWFLWHVGCNWSIVSSLFGSLSPRSPPAADGDHHNP